MIQEKHVGKVAILDIDYHHGNGTQEIFYDSPNPLYVSLHGMPDYPYYWGSVAEKGEGAGLGFTRNIPLPIGTRDDAYLAALNDAISTTLTDFNPDVVVVSLGVDTYCEDKVGNFLLSKECYGRIGKAIGNFGRPTLFVMEGGYDIETIGINVCNVLLGFQNAFHTKQ